MMGKIVGIGLVGLTQFLFWVIFTFALTTAAQHFVLGPEVPPAEQLAPKSIFEAGNVPADQITPQTSNAEFSGFLDDLKGVNFIVIIGSFLFYFMGGYLLYGSFFAAIGSAVDNEADTQQFMLPVTIPLIISILVMVNAITNPEGEIAFWFSVIPLTSPVVMMARIPFGVPWTEVLTSMVVLVITIIGSVWLAGKIYRTGILMYGKKVSYKEIWKWIRFKY